MLGDLKLEREQTSEEGSENDLIRLWSTITDLAVSTNNMVVFVSRSLPEGDYNILVEAEGYEPGEATQAVVPGGEFSGDLSIQMKKIE